MTGITEATKQKRKTREPLPNRPECNRTRESKTKKTKTIEVMNGRKNIAA
jgi:hypothetical protein